MSREDSGLYSCQASNGVGSPKMCEAKRMIVGVFVHLHASHSLQLRLNQERDGQEKAPLSHFFT